MKKIIAMLCALLMLILVCIPVYADQTLTSTGSKSITLEYTVASSYIVTIPSSVDFSGGSASIDISVDSLSLGEGQSLRVNMSSSHYANNKWNLQDIASATNLLSYSVKLDGSDMNIATAPSVTAMIIDNDSTPEERSRTFNLAITGDNPLPSTYQDILTFSCSITP